MSFRNTDFLESLRSGWKFEEGVGIKKEHNSHDGVISNKLEKLVFQFLERNLFLSFFFLQNLLLNFIPKQFIVFAFNIPNNLFRFLRFFHEHIDNCERLFHILNNFHDSIGPCDIKLAELMNDSDVLLAHFFVFFGEEAYLLLNWIYLFFFHFLFFY